LSNSLSVALRGEIPLATVRRSFTDPVRLDAFDQEYSAILREIRLGAPWTQTSPSGPFREPVKDTVPSLAQAKERARMYGDNKPAADDVSWWQGGEIRRLEGTKEGGAIDWDIQDPGDVSPSVFFGEKGRRFFNANLIAAGDRNIMDAIRGGRKTGITFYGASKEAFDAAAAGKGGVYLNTMMRLKAGDKVWIRVSDI